MGLLLTFILIGFAIGTICSLCFDDWDILWCWVVPLGIIGASICGIVFLVSWDSAVDQKKRLASIEQYATRITTYEGRAKGNFDDTSSVTDLKYNSFQGQLGEMVTELSSIIIRYNQTQVGKKIYSDKAYFWPIIVHDSSIPASINMEDYIN